MILIYLAIIAFSILMILFVGAILAIYAAAAIMDRRS